MALHLCGFFLLSVDLTLASTLLAVLYVLACFCLASLISFVVFLSSFGVAQQMKRNIGQKERAIMILVSKSAIGRLLMRKLDQAGFNVLVVNHSPEKEAAPLLEKERSSNNTKVTQLPEAEENYQKAIQNLIESQPPLKEMCGMMKKPSVMIWEEEAETSKESEMKMPCKQKKEFSTLTCLIALLWAPVNIICPCLKKRCFRWLATLLKSQSKQGYN